MDEIFSMVLHVDLVGGSPPRYRRNEKRNTSKRGEGGREGKGLLVEVGPGNN